tara:strand:+ start:2234 stop:2434 length:201 start_codon:yes stop_codon:yes gene_type:complete
MKRDEAYIDDEEVKPLKRYQFDIHCRFELKAESKPEAIIIAVERLEGIEITNVQELKCQELVKSDR